MSKGMGKIGIGNFRLPDREPNRASRSLLVADAALSAMKSFVSPQVMDIMLRALERAEIYDCKHPFWNSLARCYVRIPLRRDALSKAFPGITRVIHNTEVLEGDILVSDFHSGLNYGYLFGGKESVQIRVMEVDGDTVRGEVMRPGIGGPREIGAFRNELWYFVSHRFAVHSGTKSSKHWSASKTSLRLV